MRLDGIVHLRLRDSAIVENRKAWNKDITFCGDYLNTSACKLQLADVGIDRYKFLGRDSLKVTLGACSYLQDKFAVDILVIGALDIRYLRDDSLGFIHGGITKGKTIFADYQLIALLVLQKSIGVVVRCAVDTPIDCFGDIHSKDIKKRLKTIYHGSNNPEDAVHHGHLRIALKLREFEAFVALRNGCVVYIFYRSTHTEYSFSLMINFHLPPSFQLSSWVITHIASIPEVIM